MTIKPSERERRIAEDLVDVIYWSDISARECMKITQAALVKYRVEVLEEAAQTNKAIRQLGENK